MANILQPDAAERRRWGGIRLTRLTLGTVQKGVVFESARERGRHERSTTLTGARAPPGCATRWWFEASCFSVGLNRGQAMSDSDISALRDEIRSLKEKVSDLDLRLWSIEGWLSFFWPKLLAIGAVGFLIVESIIHW